MTATVNNWLPLFTRPQTVEILLDSWRFLQREGNLTLFGYVILENHLHLVAASPNLPAAMQRFNWSISRSAWQTDQVLTALYECAIMSGWSETQPR
uniref:Transposase IS200 like n=2 Tax=unclassified Candidatus Kentrum TaxID=2643149 RepID=A0A450UN33_9GAMM|nr:MAG: hypothetical protein BECKLFY1418A_GA0070994_103528 [Candidatus Kentron sp. LFY]VFK23105.1 MAG: hypothetical protein BECKLFY1418C_GA0070996_11345 [Candidatus Kentron sp. LFY]